MKGDQMMSKAEVLENLEGCITGFECDKNGKPNGNITCDLTEDILNIAKESVKKCMEYEKELDKIISVLKTLQDKTEENEDYCGYAYFDHEIRKWQEVRRHWEHPEDWEVE